MDPGAKTKVLQTLLVWLKLNPVHLECWKEPRSVYVRSKYRKPNVVLQNVFTKNEARRVVRQVELQILLVERKVGGSIP